jgi:hypothetical protein
MAFAAMGFRVEAVCPHGHPLRKTRAVHKIHTYGILRPLDALASIVLQAMPTLIVPCDDRTVRHLHALHARLVSAGASAAAAIIERSLGGAGGYGITESRSELIGIAHAEGIRAPETYAVETIDDVRHAVRELGLPAVMKVDGTWGGFGVLVVDSLQQAEQLFYKMSRPLQGWKAVKRLLVDRDPFHLLPWLSRTQPKVSIQRFVRGRPANCVASCWNGEVLTSIGVEVLNALYPFGASTIVRVIDDPGMSSAVTRLVRRLGISGFCGVDFVIEDATGEAYLIELNPRSTPICHLALSDGRDPAGTLAACLSDVPIRQRWPMTTNDVVAFFPQAWHLDPANRMLHTGFHDIPWEEPDLVGELIRLPWPDRGLLARLLRRLRSSGHTSGQTTQQWSYAAHVKGTGLNTVSLSRHTHVSEPAHSAAASEFAFNQRPAATLHYAAPESAPITRNEGRMF